MDGGQGVALSARSLTRQLAIWITLVIAVLGVIGGCLSFAGGYREARRLQDSHLEDIARLIDAGKLALSAPNVEWADGRDADSGLVISRVAHNGTATALSASGALPADNTLENGLHNVHFKEKTWRVYVETAHNGDRLIVAERTTIRDQIALDGSLRTVLPLLALTPVLIFVIIKIARGALAPVKRLAAVVDRQDETTLEILSEHQIAKELLPFIRSINRLIDRVKASMVQQQRFIADAAHELRSPLAALSLLANNLGSATDADAAKERLQTLQAAVSRNARLVEQLLTLARSQDASTVIRSEISLQQLASDAIQDAIHLATEREIDLGIAYVDDIRVTADGAALAILLKNLVDNAVKYVPRKGQVDIELRREGNALICRVRDSGPGVPREALPHITERFYRVPGTVAAGSGLGLSIVAETARQSGGRLDFSHTAHGFIVSYTHPL